MRRFDAILFDLDNTLCRHEQSAETIYRGAFEYAGVDPFGAPEELWRALDGDPPPRDAAGYLADGFGQIADRHGVSVDADALAAGFLETVDYRAVSFCPGAEQALAAARDRAQIGLVTNGPSSRQSVKLDALGLAAAFDVVVYAGDLPRRKPYRDPFDRALESLAVAPGSALYVGDSVEHDVVGARRAGLRVAWCPADDETAAAYRRGEAAWPGGREPDYVLDGLGELVAVLGGDRDRPA
ncbi:HAD family hydrolase [Salinigranum marinum]|uniref:HAD family hydrolase n=1 Tax=Salinigranum marinum TaxID=1515595 RepID=UPI002989C909|nr:HAD family hydrolase [Salinigranum marinum]